MSTQDDTTQGSAFGAALIQWSAQPKSSRDRALATVMEAAKQERGRALRAALTAARDCGQSGVCANAPGCARHWEERNRELAAELAAERAKADRRWTDQDTAMREAARSEGAREERGAIVPLLIQLADTIRARGSSK